MDKEKLKKLASDPRFISGIYNYCDRWCERCEYTSKCLNFATTEGEHLTSEERDISNEAFWDKMGEIFSLTREIIEDSAEELGIDPAEHNQEDIQHEQKCFDEACDHDLAKLSEIYGEIAKVWLDNIDKLLNDKEIEFFDRITLGIETENIDYEASTIRNALDVIIYYLFFIHAKVVRALHEKIEDVTEESEESPKDYDGSAKIAMIAIERSISSWGVLLQTFPGEEDFILSMLVHLKRLRVNVQKEFPGAMAFVRPGFDD